MAELTKKIDEFIETPDLNAKQFEDLPLTPAYFERIVVTTVSLLL